ncbi:MAG: hypothetical protein AAFY88_02225 [Acidobacteriota bacterium]
MHEKPKAEGFTAHRLTSHGTASWAGWRQNSDLIVQALFPAQE